MIAAKPLSRSFTYNGVKLPDPDPRMTAEEVKSLYSHQYPELATAAITGREASGEQCSTASSERLGRRGNPETDIVLTMCAHDCTLNVRTHKRRSRCVKQQPSPKRPAVRISICA